MIPMMNLYTKKFERFLYSKLVTKGFITINYTLTERYSMIWIRYLCTRTKNKMVFNVFKVKFKLLFKRLLQINAAIAQNLLA